MKIGALYLFDQCIAGWHWSWSITWRWVLRYHKWHGNKTGFFYFEKYRGGIEYGLNTKIGCLIFSTQKNMKREVETQITLSQFYKDIESLHKLVECLK